MRRMMKKARTQVVAMARKPRTTMTAMAQCGKPELLVPAWTPPVGLTPEGLGDLRDSEEPVVEAAAKVAVAETEATDDVDAMEARTKSANVVSRSS
jgi:hypothetical protein